MALLTLHRIPSISTAPDESLGRRGRLQKRESFALVKGAVLLLEDGDSRVLHEDTSPAVSSPVQQGSESSDTRHRHLHAMFEQLRPEDNIKLAVQLESLSSVRVRYLIVVSTVGNKQESILLGMDFPSSDSDQCTIGLVLPIWSDTQVYLDGDGRLSSLDSRLSLLEILHKEFQSLRESLEFSQQQVRELAAENTSLKGTVTSLTDEVNRLQKDNRSIKETVIDLQARSMRDNLVFSGIPEQAEEDPEVTVKNFIKTHLKLPEDTVNNITFHRVHRLGGKRPDGQRPRPIVAKFEHYKQKEQVRSRGPQLRGLAFSVNDQFPREILDRRRILFPIRRRFIEGGSRAVISVDKLYVNGQLYRDQNTTPWLY